jgi:hypothetical protein
MAKQITYYAMIDEFTSRDNPRTVFRRTQDNDGTTDEIFARSLTWEFSPLMYSAERGDLANEFVKISEAEATRIVDRIRDAAASAE